MRLDRVESWLSWESALQLSSAIITSGQWERKLSTTLENWAWAGSNSVRAHWSQESGTSLSAESFRPNREREFELSETLHPRLAGLVNYWVQTKLWKCQPGAHGLLCQPKKSRSSLYCFYIIAQGIRKNINIQWVLRGLHISHSDDQL